MTDVRPNPCGIQVIKTFSCIALTIVLNVHIYIHKYFYSYGNLVIIQGFKSHALVIAIM